MELSFSGTSWEVNDFKQNFGPFSGTELLVSTVVVIAGFWSGDVGGVEPEHSRVNSSQATLVRNIWGFSPLVPSKREKMIKFTIMFFLT